MNTLQNRNALTVFLDSKLGFMRLLGAASPDAKKDIILGRRTSSFYRTPGALVLRQLKDDVCYR
jgi:hypothetical protein